MISKHILLIIFLNEPGLIFFTQLNGFTYFYFIRIILSTINDLFAQYNVFKYCYVLLTIQLDIHLFTHS